MPSSLPLLLALLLALAAVCVHAVKFELPAMPAGTDAANKRCLSMYINKDTFVRGKYNIGDGANQQVDVEVMDASPHVNQYFAKKDLVSGDGKFVFTTQEFAMVSFCFRNTLHKDAKPAPDMHRTVELVVDTGAEAKDDSAFEGADEALKPAQIELRRLESMFTEIGDEMEYLRNREVRLRNTNESTNERVVYFSILSMVTLGGVGLWQIFYLRKFFRDKKLI
ncbi:vesicle coat component [Sorochytrium milnesiophthora]